MEPDSHAIRIDDVDAMEFEEYVSTNMQIQPIASTSNFIDTNDPSENRDVINISDSESETQRLEVEQTNENSSEPLAQVLNSLNQANLQSLSVLRTDVNINGEVSPTTSQKTSSETDGASPKKRPHVGEEEFDDDGTTCSICLDNWTNLGEHRICALKCGHLFGFSCITRWFSLQRKKSCPTCKKKASRGDLRYIYAKKLIAMDVAELEAVKKQLEGVTEEKNKIQIELTKAVCREHLIMQQVEDLKKKVQYLESAIEVKRHFSNSQPSSDSSGNETVRLYMDKSLEICKEAGCRVLDCFSGRDLIVVSMKSPNTLFPGFGVRKIDISTYKPTAFIPLHSKVIRDVRFHPENPWLLSVSLDKTIKIVDTTSNMPITVNTSGDVPLWSCCWDINDSNMLFVGKQQGSVAKFDIRHMSEPICTLDVPGDMSPVVSVSAIAACPESAVANGGIISCKLNSVWVFENTPDSYTRYPLPLEGPFVSMAYHNDKQQLLVSTRSSLRYPNARHLLCNIEKGRVNTLLCNTVHCFTGSTTQKFLSRSCLLTNASNCYVAAHQECNRSVFLWSVRTGSKVASLPARDPVLDLCGLNINNTSFVVSLTEKKLEFFKFI